MAAVRRNFRTMTGFFGCRRVSDTSKLYAGRQVPAAVLMRQRPRMRAIRDSMFRGERTCGSSISSATTYAVRCGRDHRAGTNDNKREAKITDVRIRVGHFTLTQRPQDAVIIVDGAGAAAGDVAAGRRARTRETDLLDPLVHGRQGERDRPLGRQRVHGLDAAQGVMRYLEEKGVGYQYERRRSLPIVPAAVIFGLPFGGKSQRFDRRADCGYRAATDATNGPVREGTVERRCGAPRSASSVAPKITELQ